MRENDSRLKRKSKGGSGDWGSGEPLELGDFWNGEWGVEIENGEEEEQSTRVFSFAEVFFPFFKSLLGLA